MTHRPQTSHRPASTQFTQPNLKTKESDSNIKHPPSKYNSPVPGDKSQKNTQRDLSQRENQPHPQPSSSSLLKGKNYLAEEEEIMSKIREQLKNNFQKISAMDKYSARDKSHSQHNKSASIIVDKSLRRPQNNISAVDIKRKESPRNFEDLHKKILNNAALQSVYKKVGKYLNKSEIAIDSKKITINTSSNNADKVPSRSHSQEKQFRNIGSPRVAVDIVESEKTIKPYLNHVYEESRAESPSYNKNSKLQFSREVSPRTQGNNSKEPVYNLVSKEKGHQRSSSKKLAKIVDSSTKHIVEEAIQRSLIAEKLQNSQYSIISERKNSSFYPVGPQPKDQKAPSFFKQESPKNHRSTSPYDLNMRRESNASPIFEPVRGSSQPNIFSYGQGLYLKPGASPILDHRKSTGDEPRDTSNFIYFLCNLLGNNITTDVSKIRIEENREPQNRPSHKKGSKSVNAANPLDMLIKGLNLPINANKLNKENMLTPNVSEPNSGNVSLIIPKERERVQREREEASKRERERDRSKEKETNVTAQEIKSRAASVSQVVVEQDEAEDDELLRDRLIKIIKDSFRVKGTGPPTTLDYYRLIKMIGKGAFGKVYLGVHLLTGKHVAIKTIEKACMKDEASKRKVFQEVLILRKTNHKNIEKLLEVFENKKYLFMVLENASRGDLLGLVKRKGRMTEEEAKKIFYQIVAGIRYCHHSLILHRDVKLDNILLDEHMVVKICDFGVSRFIKKGQIINEQCGTPAYIAPEIIKDEGYEGCYADIWSMGVLLYAMVTGTVPFKANNLEELHDAILSGEYTFPDYLSVEVKDLIYRMLKLNPYHRISIDDIPNHPWLRDAARDDDKFPEGETMERSYNGKSFSMDQGNTVQIVESIVRKIEELGYPREYVIKSVNLNSCNHATACYHLLYKDYMELMS